MEEDKHAVVDLSEGEERGGGWAPWEGPFDEVGDASGGLVGGAASTEPEVESAVGNACHGVASEIVKKDDLEEPSPESEGVAAVGGSDGHGTASDGDKDNRHEVPKNPIATRFAFRATDANATPVSTYCRMLSRGRKSAGPTRFVAAGASASAGSNTPAPSTSSSEPVTGSLEDASAVPDADHGASPGGEKKKDLEAVEQQSEARFVPGHAAANAIPPSTFRIRPSRRRKQSSPTRSILSGANPPPPCLLAVISSAPDASVASTSHRALSRSRKQPRPERFIPEEGEAAARAKARRSGIALDRFITSQLNNPSGPSTEWEREVTAADASDQQEQGTTTDRHSCSIHIPESVESQVPPGEPSDDRRRIYGVLAVLGASLALSMIACVLFYIVGSESTPCDQNQE